MEKSDPQQQTQSQKSSQIPPQQTLGEREKIKAERGAARKAQKDSISGTSEKRGRPKKKKPLDPEFVKTLKRAYYQFVGTCATLANPQKTVEEKKKATNEYLVAAGELVIIKYAWLFNEYAEETNFAAACGLWGGYRAKLVYMPSIDGVDGASGGGMMVEAMKAAGDFLKRGGTIPGMEIPAAGDGKPESK